MSDETNISRLREMAVYGKEYRDTNTYDYFGGVLELVLGPLEDKHLIPIAGTLQAEFGMEVDEASEEIEESRDEAGDIDPSKLDRNFVRLMAEAALHGIDTDEGDAEGETKDGLREILGIADEEGDNIGLRGGLTLEISQDVLDLSDDEESAEKFRR